MTRRSLSTDRDDPGGDPLDALLQDAAWPEVDSLRIARLQRQWDRLVRRRRRRWQWLSAAAAVVMLLGGGTWYRLSHTGGPRTVEVTDLSEERRVLDDQDPSGMVSLPPRESDASSLQRSIVDNDAPPIGPLPDINQHEHRTVHQQAVPNVYQNAMLAALDRRLRTTSQVAPVDAESTVVQTVKQVTSDTQADIAQLTGSWGQRPAAFERELAAFIRRSSGKEKLAAIRLLAHVATQRSLPLLLELRRWPPAHAESTRAIMRLGSSSTVYRLACQETTVALKRELMAELLERNKADALHWYVNLASDPATAAFALDAAATVSDAPVEALVRKLCSPRIAERITVARVLGRLPDPSVSRVLVDMVLNDVCQREALIALCERTDLIAVEFLARARRSVMLAASARAAQLRSESFPN